MQIMMQIHVPGASWQVKQSKLLMHLTSIFITLLNQLYGVWQHDCFPTIFVFKTLAIETNLYGLLVEFQDFISKAAKNVTEPLSTRKSSYENENITF